MADAYKVLRDTTFPKPLRTAVTTEGVEITETLGVAYAAGEYLLEEDLTERDRERVENGDLEDFLEDASTDDYEASKRAEKGLFIPEHEVERYALLAEGHRIVEKDQLLDLRTAGSDAVASYMEESKDGPDDANPLVTEQDSFVETPDITTAQNSDEPVLPGEGKQDPVEEEDLLTATASSVAGVEMPPGIPVGPTLAAAAGEEVEAVEEAQTPQTPQAPPAAPSE